jgi:arylsulfatase
MGMPGSPHGIPDWTPSIADLMKAQGYGRRSSGKNHFGDRTSICPPITALTSPAATPYHLNAEEEPETYYYLKIPSSKKSTAGVIRSFADGRIQDTGPGVRPLMSTSTR